MAAFNGNDPMGAFAPAAGKTVFNDQTWHFLLDQLALAIGPQAAKYQDNQVAKLSAAIAYLAGSEDTDRYALANLLVYHAATQSRAIFDHRPSDDQDLYRRLGAYRFGQQADPAAVRYGLNLLARVMVNDHAFDEAEDRAAGKYNPVGAGVWDVAQLQAQLDADLGKDAANRMLYSEYTPIVTMSWWIK